MLFAILNMQVCNQALSVGGTYKYYKEKKRSEMQKWEKEIGWLLKQMKAMAQ
jgi:hypothetical protein